MTQENHHHFAHEYFYLKRRTEFLEHAKLIGRGNDPLEWEYLRDEYADVCDGQAFIEILRSRCGYAPSKITEASKRGSATK